MFVFVSLLVLFIIAASFILHRSRRAFKNFMYVFFPCALAIAIFGFFVHSYQKLDARLVFFLLIATVVLSVFFITHKYRY